MQVTQTQTETQTTQPMLNFWQRFKQRRSAYYALWVLVCFLGLGICSGFLSNDKPLLVYYKQQIYLPMLNNHAETTFDGELDTPANYQDPWLIKQINQYGWLVPAINAYSPYTLDEINPQPSPAKPSIRHLLGTDDHGRDILARLLYALKTSLLFALALAGIHLIIGVMMGMLQAYIGGKFDLIMQRLLEIWGSFPELYVWLLLASLFKPSMPLLLILLSLFGWLGIADYIRSECLKIKQLDYIKQAQIMGLPSWRILLKHVLPNVLSPILAFLPFRISGGILAISTLDFLGLGLPLMPSIGDLLNQSKNNLEAWWILLPTMLVLVSLTLSLSLVGNGLRKASGSRI